MILLIKYQSLAIVLLIAAFLIAIILDKKPIALSISILFFSGLLMFIAGLTTVLGWVGMDVTISGIIYSAAALLTTMICSIKIYFSTKKIYTRVFHSG